MGYEISDHSMTVFINRRRIFTTIKLYSRGINRLVYPRLKAHSLYRGENRSRRYVDDVMRQVRAQTTDARDDANGAGIPHQLPKREPCSNGHDACDD